jgi:hypothetical protein
MRHVSEGAVKTGSQAPGLGRDTQPLNNVSEKKNNGNNQSTDGKSWPVRYGAGTKRALRVVLLRAVSDFEGAETLRERLAGFLILALVLMHLHCGLSTVCGTSRPSPLE